MIRNNPFPTTWPAALGAALALILGSTATALPAAAAGTKPTESALVEQRIVEEGVAIELRVEELAERDGKLTEGEAVRVSFDIRDTTSGSALGSLYPAAWLDRRSRGAESAGKSRLCEEKVKTFLGGTLFAQPEMDLNVYYVLALNEDPSITVVDPLFGFGNSKLLDIVVLESPGEDWVLGPLARKLYVTMPAVGRLAVVDTATWRVEQNVEIGPRPGRLALQADGRSLWVANDLEQSTSGVTVLDLETREVAARIPTGKGRHDVLLSPGDRWAWVSNAEDGTVTMIDVRTRTVAGTLETGPRPVSLAYSDLGGAAYVADQADGSVSVLAGDRPAVVARLESSPGLAQIRFAPGGRLGFAVNPEEDEVVILDAARQRILQTATVEEEPDQVSFTDELAYIRHRGSEIVLMIPLDEVGREGAPVPVVDFPGGQRPASAGGARSPAPAIVQAPGSPAVLIANPADEMIYFYKEGMAAPMGSFKNYGRQPRAVEVVDRSLREHTPGRYETTVQLRRPGSYDVAFYLDSPQLVHCFGLEIEAAPGSTPEPTGPAVEVEYLGSRETVAVGAEVPLRFRLSEPGSAEPLDGVEDLKIMTFLAPGIWQQRFLARPVGGGVYEASFTPPREGLYYVFLGAGSLGLELRESRFLVLEAVEAEGLEANLSR